MRGGAGATAHTMGSEEQITVSENPRKRVLKSGRVSWEARYRDPAGRHRSKSFPLKRDAVAFLEETRRDLRRREWIDPSNDTTTVAEIMAGWMAAEVREPSTMALYDNTLRLQLGWLGEYPASQVTSSDINRWHHDLLTDRHWNTGARRKGLSEGNARDQVRRVRSAFLWAVDEQIVARSPVVVPRLPDDDEEVVALDDIPTIDEINTVVDLIRRGGATYTEVKRRGGEAREYTMRPHPVAADMLVAAMLTGMRINELCGLIVTDVDWDAGVIRFSRQMDVKTRRRKKPKSRASRRVIPIAPELEPVLRRHAEGKGPGAWLFSGPQGQSIRSSRLAVYVKRAREHAGVERVNFHACRHYFASALITAGIPIHEVSEVLGHRSPSTTLNVYTHVIERDGAGMRSAISSAIGCGISAGSRHLRAVP